MDSCARPLLLAVALFLFAAPPYARAEQDHQFAQALTNEGYFDLAERVLRQMQKSRGKQQRVNALLGLGTLKKRLAEQARTSEQQRKLYAEAIEYFEKFIRQAPADHPKLPRAKAKIVDIKLKRLKVKLRAIESGEITNPQEIGEIRRGGERLFDEILEPLKRAADKAAKKFNRFYRNINIQKLTKAQKEQFNRLFKAAVIAQQKYIMKAFEKQIVYSKISPRRKAWFEKQLIPHVQQARDDYDSKEGTLSVVMWLNFYLGKCHTAVEAIEAAKAVFNEVLKIKDADEYVETMHRQTYYELAKMYLQAKKYEDAVQAAEMQLDLFRPDLRDPQKGLAIKATQLVAADALTAQNKYDEAIKKCELVVRNDEDWLKRRAENKITEILGKMKPAAFGDQPARVLFAAGEGALRQAVEAERMNQPRPEIERYYEQAIRNYRLAADAARRPGAALRDRLEILPRSWFQAGIGYYRLGLLYEAQFLFKAFLENFGALPDLVLHDPDGAKLARYLKTLKGARKERLAAFVTKLKANKTLHKQVESIGILVPKAAGNLRIAADRRKKKFKHAFDIKLYEEALKDLIKYDPTKAPEMEFFLAEAVHEQAEGLAVRAREARSHKNRAAAARELEDKAVNKFQEAAEKYGAVKPASQYYENALFSAGFMAYQAMNLIQGRLEKTPEDLAPEVLAQVQQFGEQALSRWRTYQGHVAQTSSVDPRTLLHRARKQKDIRRAMPSVYFNMRNYDKCLESVNAYLAWKPQAQALWQRQAKGPEWNKFIADIQKGAVALKISLDWLKFNAYRKMALRTTEAATDVTGLGPAEQMLAQATALGEAWEQNPDARDKYFVAAMLRIGSTYTQFANKVGDWHAEAKQKQQDARSENDIDEVARLQDRIDQLKAKIDEYNGQSAFWLKRILNDPDYQGLDFMSSIAEKFFQLKDWKNCQEVYARVLKKFDPENDIEKEKFPAWNRARNAHDAWAQAAGKINVIPFEKTKAFSDIVKNVIPDYIFDDPKVHEMDLDKIEEKLIDFDNALDEIEKLFKAVEKLQLKNGKKQTLQCAPFLQKIQAELEFRLKILNANDRISQCYMRLAQDAEKGSPGRDAQENALGLWQAAAKSFQALSHYWWSDPGIQMHLATCRQAQGRLNRRLGQKDAARAAYQQTHKTLLKIKDFAQRGDDLWWNTTRSLAQTELALGELGGHIKVWIDGRAQQVAGMQLIAFAASRITPYYLLDQDSLERKWPGAEAFLKEAQRANPKINLEWQHVEDVPDVDLETFSDQERELSQLLAGVDMTILEHLGRPIRHGLIAKDVIKAIAAVPNAARKKRIRNRRRAEYARICRDRLPTRKFASKVPYEKMHKTLKEKLSFAGIKEAEARGLLAQGRIIQAVIKADYRLLLEHDLKRLTADVSLDVDNYVRKEKIKETDRRERQKKVLREALVDPDLNLYTFDTFRKNVRDLIRRAGGRKKDAARAWMDEVEELLKQAKLGDSDAKPGQ